MAKMRDKIQDEAFKEGLNFYRKWRQKTKNGILPIGIAEVGKTTLLHKFEVSGPNLFMDFNRTLRSQVDDMRLRQEFIDQCQGVEYFKKIDVPGELPEQWAKAYFDNNPRVLLILVDDRPPIDHLPSIRKFLSIVKQGPTKWQSLKMTASFKWNNLSRVLFVINKVDKFDSSISKALHSEYASLLADVHSQFNSSIQIFSISLNPESAQLGEMFSATLEGLSRK